MANGRSQWSADFNPVEMRRPMLPGPPAPNSGFAFRVDAPEFVPRNRQPLGGHMHGVGDFRHPQMNQQHPIHVMGPGAPPMMQPQYNPQPQYGQMPGYQQPPPNNSPYYAMRMAIQPVIRTNSVQNRLNYAQQQQQQQQLHQQQIHQQQMQLAQQHPQPQIPVQLQQNPYPNMGSSGMNCNDRVASYENFDDGSGSAGVDESTNDAELHALNYLLEIVEKVNKEPGQYESVQKELTGIFIEFAQNNFVMSNAVEIVFEQSIREQNFRYMGAKICRLLDSIDPSPSSVFRNLLCYKMDYQQKELFQFMANESHKVRGTALFLAELYIQLQNDGSRLVSIAEHILGTLNLLLERKTPENVKCVCQCLKLCGYELEVDCPSETADVLASLENVAEMDNSTNRLLQSVLDLRNNRWGRSEQLAIKGEINSIGRMPVEIHDGPVFYGPDGQIMTEEENTFLLSNIKTYDKPYDDFGDEDPDELVEPDSEMTPEIQQAFKDFVKIGKK